MHTPLALAAYVGPLTWDDTGWRSCPLCEVEWLGPGSCFLEPAHAGRAGRLASWCKHGLRLVAGHGAALCPDCERHEASDYTHQFVELLVIAADHAIATTRDQSHMSDGPSPLAGEGLRRR